MATYLTPILASDWAQWYSSLNNDQLVFAWLTVTLCIVGLVIVVVTLFGVVGSVIKHRAELEFKRELIGHGMSADEIEQIIRARSQGTKPRHGPVA